MHHDKAGQPFPFLADGFIHPIEVVVDHDPAGFGAVVAALSGLGEAPALRVELGRIKLAQGESELVAGLVVEASLVAFDAQDVVAALLNDALGDGGDVG